MNILIAEDHPDSRIVLQKTLESAGHKVIAAVHGEEALKKAQETPPDLIISDILMPIMDGFKLCYAVKNDDRLRHIPFIFYTATYIDLEDEQLAMELGASRFIVKPVDPIEFLKILDEMIAEAGQGELKVPETSTAERKELFKTYDSRLSKKLTKKSRELDQYKRFFQNSSDLFCILSAEGDILQVNGALCLFYNCDEQQLLGHSAKECFGESCFHAMFKAVSKKNQYRAEIKAEIQSEESLSLDVTALPYLDENNALAAILVQSRDITKRKRDEAKLKKAHEIINRSPAVAIQWKNEPGWPVEFVSENIDKLLGYSAQELLDGSSSYTESVHKDDIDRVSHEVTSNSENPEQQKFTHEPYRLVTRSGQIIWVEDITYIRRNDTGKITHYEGVIYDISDRMAAVERERQVLREWTRTFDSSTDIITIQDRHNHITQCNQAAIETFSLPRKEIIGKPCFELFRGKNEICPGCPISHTVETFEPYSEEIVHEHLKKTFSVNVSPLVNDNGELTGIAHFAKDITGQKKLEDQLRQTQKMESLGTLAGGIAHDFNNILSAILGYSQLAQAHLPADSKARDALKQVVIGGQRAAELVKQILSFSRKTEHQIQPVKVQAIIAETLKLLRPSIPTTIEILSDIDEDAPPILADPVQIHQIIMNFCTNAYHAMREEKSGTLELQLSQVDLDADLSIPQLDLPIGSYLQLRINDTGSGMDKATMARIFEPYFTTKKQGEGTGLGLAVAQSIIRDFGGHISVYSEPGQGTCFKIYLPVPLSEPQTEGNIQIPVEVPMGTEKVLVVDDEEPISDLIRLMLERYGYRVTNCFDSTEALRAFQENPNLFDLVVTDYAMPTMNGIDLAEKLLKIRANVPIVLCTGFSDKGNQAKALKSGIKACLNKPLQADQLALAVRKYLDEVGE